MNLEAELERVNNAFDEMVIPLLSGDALRRIKIAQLNAQIQVRQMIALERIAAALEAPAPLGVGG